MTANLVPISPPRGVDTTDTEQVALVRRMLVPENVTEDEFQLFVQVANHAGLDPIRRQIYAQKRSGKLVVLTGIDGYRAIAARTGLYAGQDDATFEGKSRNKQGPGRATVTVYKMVAGLRCPFTASARWDEYVPPSTNNQDAMWKKMPHNQLAKCAEALALRKAFPEETSGIYVEDTMSTDLGARTIDPEPSEPDPLTRDEILAERYEALDLNLKVAFKAWLGTEGMVKPYDESALDRIAVKLDELEGVTEAEEVAVCEVCGEPATASGLCAEHELPPDAMDPDTLPM